MPAGNQQGDDRGRQRAVFQLVDGDVRGQVIDAVQRPTSSAPDSPGPAVTAIASTSVSLTPAVASARSTAGTIASRCARLATSGTTPPNLACSATLDATASASSS